MGGTYPNLTRKMKLVSSQDEVYTRRLYRQGIDNLGELHTTRHGVEHSCH
jgi:hypothetical protein